ncbi:hypothetical protein [Staphylococcus phage APTC_SA_12]|nr:MAG: hypothetical protein [Staphylococcus phage RP2]UPO38538.1 hypothetical protein [Staphylococcus phage vB_SaS_GE1]UWV20058.1 hypothetical protein [Staphylococcus phage APTC_SA_2]UWV20306.1 hypothetical protein [Staphylococcus phage APTC_SA_4]UWV20481.1 hypothetical protein [Staphylococcus phage APTC_SA_12]UWV20643.1 hypothetical protein [Staphylococcus phage APTC_SA_13]WMT38763.1 hypothetical protein [Staphylococcus phage Sp2021]WPH67402.1 hypothetical protein CUBM_gp243 [Staphylococcu
MQYNNIKKIIQFPRIRFLGIFIYFNLYKKII